MLYNKESTLEDFIHAFFSEQTFLMSNKPLLKDEVIPARLILPYIHS